MVVRFSGLRSEIGSIKNSMSYVVTIKRVRQRIKLSLPIRLTGLDRRCQPWSESSRLIDVNPFGARFTMRRLTEPGRLLRLTLMMPRQLRCFDHVEDQYRVWSLVRHVTEVTTADASLLDIGVGFIGKHPPMSYNLKPYTRYTLAETASEGRLWGMREMGALQALGARHERGESETRLRIAVNVEVEVLDDDGHSDESEKTITENISRQGTCVFTTLNVEEGQFVRLINLENQMCFTAAIRSRSNGSDGFTRLHLQFVGGRWPIEEIETVGVRRASSFCVVEVEAFGCWPP